MAGEQKTAPRGSFSTQVVLQPEGLVLEHVTDGATVSLIVPKVTGHQIVVIET